jgi:hypothetical protein
MLEFRLQKTAVLHAIAASLGHNNPDFSRIRSRQQLLGRMGYPEGANTGRGYRGGYDLEQLFKLVFCFQMLRFDFALSRTITVAKQSWPIARSAVVHSLQGHSIPGRTFYWVGEPPRLDDFKTETVKGGPIATTAQGGSRVVTVAVADGKLEHSMQTIARDQFGLSCAWFVNVEEVVEQVLGALAHGELGIDQDDLQHALDDWSK